MSLFKLVRSDKSENPFSSHKYQRGMLCSLIESMDRQADPPRKNEDGLVHVSSLVRGDCPRAIALSIMHKTYAPQSIQSANRIVWAIGRAVENHVRIQLIESVGADMVYGRWSCKCGTLSFVGRGGKSSVCGACDSPANQYFEEPLRDLKHGLIGNPDITLLIGGRIMPVEIKSIKTTTTAQHQGFDTLRNDPLTDHALQVACYYRMASLTLSKKLGMRMAKRPVVLYAAKDFTPGSAYKEMPVHLEDYEKQVDDIFADSLAIKHMIAGGSPVNRLSTCSKITSSTALKCGLVHPCFHR